MKICINDDINTVIYINKEYSSDIDFSNELEIENYFKKIFNKLKTFYNISIKGFYNIDVYLDNYYGIVLNLEKENIDYYDYFDNHIDMQFRIKKYSSFLYKLNDFSLEKILFCFVEKFCFYCLTNSYLCFVSNFVQQPF